MNFFYSGFFNVPNFYPPGLNTFGSHLIVAMTLPLLAIVPFTFCMIFPVKLKFHEHDEMRKGEYILFERHSVFHNALFTVYGKYILLHGIRVRIRNRTENECYSSGIN